MKNNLAFNQMLASSIWIFGLSNCFISLNQDIQMQSEGNYRSLKISKWALPWT